jgi:hypothetical protein
VPQRAAAAPQQSPLAPALAHQIIGAPERFSVSAAEPSRFTPLPETNSPSAIEITDKPPLRQKCLSPLYPLNLICAEWPQFITHSDPVSAASLEAEPPSMLTPLAFESCRACMYAATSLPQHLKSHSPMPAYSPTPRKPVSLAGKEQESTCDMERTTISASCYLILFATSEYMTKTKKQVLGKPASAIPQKSTLLGLYRNSCHRSSVLRSRIP